ncbi:regulator of volume decrease after cellular swelling-domain-containing protein [Aspergillus californicus]
MEAITSRPETSSFTPLSVHQSRTPESFHSGPAILHYHASNCKLVALDRDLSATTALNALRGAAVNGSNDGKDSTDVNGTEDENEKEILIEGMDVWVTSDKFLLYNSTTNAGLSLIYPSISLHAIQRLKLPAPSSGSDSEVQGLYMDITKQPPASSYPQESDEVESITLTLVPPPSTSKPENEEEDELEPETETQKLYGAVSACSNLHPDPVEEDEQDGGAFASGLVFPGSAAEGGLPPPVDGSSGWITADNMHEFFDEEGNWIGGGEEISLPGLGPGAGTVRGREQDRDERMEDAEEGEGREGDETKWRRTD